MDTYLSQQGVFEKVALILNFAAAFFPVSGTLISLVHSPMIDVTFVTGAIRNKFVT
jgi:hypothetical protein